MNLSIQTDLESKQVLAVYIKIKEGKVHRTVEIAEGECYADEDKKGNLLGVELLASGTVRLHVRGLAQKYKIKGLTQAVRKAQEALTV